MRAELRSRLDADRGARRAEERRASPRAQVDRAARLVVEDLAVDGSIVQLSASGVFFLADVLVEAGERGTLEIDGKPVSVRVASNRPATASQAAGLGIAFEPADAAAERALLELVLRLLDEP